MLEASGVADDFETDERGTDITIFVPTHDLAHRAALLLPARLPRVHREPHLANARHRVHRGYQSSATRMGDGGVLAEMALLGDADSIVGGCNLIPLC